MYKYIYIHIQIAGQSHLVCAPEGIACLYAWVTDMMGPLTNLEDAKSGA